MRVSRIFSNFRRPYQASKLTKPVSSLQTYEAPFQAYEAPVKLTNFRSPSRSPSGQPSERLCRTLPQHLPRMCPSSPPPPSAAQCRHTVPPSSLFAGLHDLARTRSRRRKAKSQTLDSVQKVVEDRDRDFEVSIPATFIDFPSYICISHVYIIHI